MPITLPTLDVDEVAEAIGQPFDTWAHQCHAISLAIVKAGLLPGSRVARGSCPGVGSQHSWVVVGDDCYAEDAVIVDPTLWSYDPAVTGIWIGTPADRGHCPHRGGMGSIWKWGRPAPTTGEPIDLTPTFTLSPHAQDFLDLLGPLDRTGWGLLINHAPLEGWPAAELFAAIDDTPALSAVIPIDVLGMLTDRNPNGLYR